VGAPSFRLSVIIIIIFFFVAVTVTVPARASVSPAIAFALKAFTKFLDVESSRTLRKALTGKRERLRYGSFLKCVQFLVQFPYFMAKVFNVLQGFPQHVFSVFRVFGAFVVFVVSRVVVRIEFFTVFMVVWFVTMAFHFLGMVADCFGHVRQAKVT